MPIIARLLRHGNPVDFAAMNRAALGYLPTLVRTWCPQGRMCGHEWQALNPTRPDRTPGSSASTPRPASGPTFATGDKGGDVISLAAYMFGCRQVEAARTLAPLSAWRCGHDRALQKGGSPDLHDWIKRYGGYSDITRKAGLRTTRQCRPIGRRR